MIIIDLYKSIKRKSCDEFNLRTQICRYHLNIFVNGGLLVGNNDIKLFISLNFRKPIHHVKVVLRRMG